MTNKDPPALRVAPPAPAGRPSPINTWFAGRGRSKSHPGGFLVRIDPDTSATFSDPRPLELFITFSLISISGFGGVLYWSRRMMVDERKWMTAEEFNEAYALCNFLPGPNIVNFSVVFGRQVGGTLGALVALLGLLGPPFLLVTLLGLLYTYYGDVAALQRVLAGIAAAAAGLTISTGLKMVGPLLRQRPGFAHVVAIAAFLAVGILRWPIYWVLGVLIPCGVAVAWWTRR